MFGYNFTTLIIILVIALLLFGPRRLPELGESIGKAIRSFKKAHDDPESVTPKSEIPRAPPRRQTTTCPQCHKEFAGEFAFCPHCGARDQGVNRGYSDVGFDFETLIILAVLAFILFGPEKLPEYAAQAGILSRQDAAGQRGDDPAVPASFNNPLEPPPPQPAIRTPEPGRPPGRSYDTPAPSAPNW